MILFASQLQEHIIDPSGKYIDSLESFLISIETGHIERIIGQHWEFMPQDCAIEKNRLVARQVVHHDPLGGKSKGGASLINLPVVTESGDTLGRVVDFSFETTLFILDSIVTAKRLIPWSKRILSRKQIIEITPRRIIVVDQYGVTPDKTSYPEIIPA